MKPPTLIDTLYKASFSKDTVPGWRSNIDMRHVLESARNHRFVADDRMSAFLADLATEPFLKHQGKPLNQRICDSLRVQSRLPHESIWIEYSLHAYQKRSNEIRVLPTDLTEVPQREGWLIQQHPKIDTACILHIFSDDPIPDRHGHTVWTFPIAYAWCCDDSPLPWNTLVNHVPLVGGRKVSVSEYVVGMRGYDRDNVNIVLSFLLDPRYTFAPENIGPIGQLLQEWQGVIRRVWALLATIDNLPLSYGQVRQSKGFLARGRIRKYLDHKTITLNIPAKKDTRVIARQAIAIAHRKRHEVRGFWRNDWRHPPSSRCNPHIWEAVDESADHIVCALCSGRQTYIHKHERGDAALGYVTHDYRLKHEVVK